MRIWTLNIIFELDLSLSSSLSWLKWAHSPSFCKPTLARPHSNMTVRILHINNQKLLVLFITICKDRPNETKIELSVKDIKTDYTLLQERMLLHHLRSSHASTTHQSRSSHACKNCMLTILKDCKILALLCKVEGENQRKQNYNSRRLYFWTPKTREMKREGGTSHKL